MSKKKPQKNKKLGPKQLAVTYQLQERKTTLLGAQNVYNTFRNG